MATLVFAIGLLWRVSFLSNLKPLDKNLTTRELQLEVFFLCATCLPYQPLPQITLSWDSNSKPALNLCHKCVIIVNGVHYTMPHLWSIMMTFTLHMSHAKPRNAQFDNCDPICTCGRDWITTMTYCMLIQHDKKKSTQMKLWLSSIWT